MARGAMPWTIRIEEYLEDGEWHDVNDVIKVGADVVPRDRALAEMGESRAAHSDEDRRAEAGAKTLSRQALMGMRRFGKVELSADKRQAHKVADSSVSPGVLAERVSVLEAQVAELLARSSVLPVVAGSVTGSSRAPDQVWGYDETDDRVPDSAPGAVRVGDAEVDLP